MSDLPRRRSHRIIPALAGLALVGVAGLSAVAVSADTTTSTTAAGGTTSGAVGEAYSGQREPTEGPQSGDPAVEDKAKIDIVGGLLTGAPIYKGDFADPFALHSGTSVYLYATNTISANIPVIQLVEGNNSTANYLGDALPQLPSWTTKGKQWAPSVWARPDGTFVLHYTTPSPTGGRQCISAATATSPAGPFTDSSTVPLICPLAQGGAIDPSVFIDDTVEPNVPYLLWKADGNCCGLPTTIFIQQLSADGLSTAGPPHDLLSADQGWEGNLVEGPSLVYDRGTYYLFYSANDWNSAHYAIGVATCTSVTGPCTKPQDKAWDSSSWLSQGPGGQEFFNSKGGVWMVRHGWLPGEAGKPDGQRRLYLDLLEFGDPGAVPTRVGASYVASRLVPYLVAGMILIVVLAGAVWWWLRRRHAMRHA